MTLGQAIHEYREDHGLSMEKFSSMSGLSKAYISILERNKTPHGNIPAPSIDTYLRVAKTMSMDVNDLLSLVDDRISLINKTDPNLLSSQGTDKIVPFSEPAGDIVRFPVVASVCAGYNGLAVEEYSEETEEIPCSMFQITPSAPSPQSFDYKGLRIFSYSPSCFVDSVLRCRIPYIGLKSQRKGSNLRTDYARKSGGRSPRLYPFAMCS